MTSESVDLASAREFVYGVARLLDRRLFAVLFEDGDAAFVLTALAAYQNADGRFGHGLEPDTRTPMSQPLNVEVALQYMVDAGAADVGMAKAACDFLEAVTLSSGGVPILLPGFEAHGHASHWRGYRRSAELVPNAGIVGLLHRLGVEHPWREATAEVVWRGLESEDLGAHDILDASIFLAAVPDRVRAEATARRLAEALPGAEWFMPEPDGVGYGVPPWWFAPTPHSFCRRWFDDAVIDRHLDHLAQEQQQDGGWPISWNPPGPASELEWRGIQSVKALRTLRAYGRV